MAGREAAISGESWYEMAGTADRSRHNNFDPDILGDLTRLDMYFDRAGNSNRKRTHPVDDTGKLSLPWKRHLLGQIQVEIY